MLSSFWSWPTRALQTWYIWVNTPHLLSLGPFLSQANHKIYLQPYTIRPSSRPCKFSQSPLLSRGPAPVKLIFHPSRLTLTFLHQLERNLSTSLRNFSKFSLGIHRISAAPTELCLKSTQETMLQSDRINLTILNEFIRTCWQITPTWGYQIIRKFMVFSLFLCSQEGWWRI